MTIGMKRLKATVMLQSCSHVSKAEAGTKFKEVAILCSSTFDRISATKLHLKLQSRGHVSKKQRFKKCKIYATHALHCIV